MFKFITSRANSGTKYHTSEMIADDTLEEFMALFKKE
jgi:hypothetical protein